MVVATLLLGERIGLVYGLAAIFITGSIIYASHPGGGGSDLIFQPYWWAHSAVNLTAVTALMYLIRRSINAALGQARTSAQEMRQQADMLRRSQAQIAAILQNASDNIAILDAEGVPFYESHSVTHILGYQPDDLIGSRIFDGVHPDDQIVAVRAFRKSLGRPGDAVWSEFRYRKLSGDWVYLEVCFNNLLHDPSVKGVILNARDITERKQIDLELERYRQHLEVLFRERTIQLSQSQERATNILNNSIDSIILVHNDGVIQQTNRAFNILFRCEDDAYFGQSLTSLIVDADVEQIGSALQAVCRGGAVRRIEVSARRSDGSQFPAAIGLSPLVTTGQQVSGIVCNLQDITVYRQAEADLRKALDKERELNELRSRFVSTVSHEFRTPLATILSTTETLRDYMERMSAEERSKRFRKIQSQVEQMVLLLDDILMIGRLESGRMEINREWFDLAVFVQDIADELRGTYLKHHLNLALVEQTVMVRADKKLMRQIVVNLLSNACKYSSEDTTIDLNLESAGGHVTLRVRDHGIGIPEDDQPHLFKAFHRARNVHAIQGTGLGLAITRHAVEAHQGTITFESQVGEGTTFTVVLPIAAAGGAHS